MNEDASEETWTEFYRASVAAELTFMAGALRSAGLDVRESGHLSGAAMGAGEQVSSGALLVRTADLAEATRLLEALEDAEIEAVDELAVTSAEEAADDAEEPLPGERKPLLAAGLGAIFPGLGHMYCREFWAGGLLAVAFGLFAMVGLIIAGPVTYVGLYLFGVLGAVAAARRADLRPRSPNRQLLVMGPMVFGLYLLGDAVNPRLFPDYHLSRAAVRMAPLTMAERSEAAAKECDRDYIALPKRAPFCGLAAWRFLDPHTPSSVPEQKRGVAYATQACEGKDAYGCYMLGRAYYFGLGVKVDRAKAENLRRDSCLMGYDPTCKPAFAWGR